MRQAEGALEFQSAFRLIVDKDYGLNLKISLGFVTFFPKKRNNSAPIGL